MRLKELIWFAQVRGSWDTPPWRPCWPQTTSTFHAQMYYLFNWFVYLHSPDVIAPSNRFHTRIWKDLQNPAMEHLSFKPVCVSLIILQIHSPQSTPRTGACPSHIRYRQKWFLSLPPLPWFAMMLVLLKLAFQPTFHYTYASSLEPPLLSPSTVSHYFIHSDNESQLHFRYHHSLHFSQYLQDLIALS